MVAFLALAYGGAWLAFLPPVLAQNGLGLWPVRLPLLPFLALASVTGPALAAILVTLATTGQAGLRTLARRYRVEGVAWRWWLLALDGPLAALLVGAVVALGRAPVDEIERQIGPVLITYVMLLVGGLLTGPLGEELGWRGWALPVLQKRMGPLGGGLSLGLIWAGWHLPLFLLADWAGTGDRLPVAAAFVAWVVPFSVLMTWVFNRTGGNVAVTTLLHAAENAATGLIGAHLLLVPADLFLQARVYGVLAVLVVAITRGRLGYQPSAATPTPALVPTGPTHPLQWLLPLTPRRTGMLLVLGLALIWVIANIGYQIVNPR
jgi:membrane protease YdiL (CAAX protease family)